MTMEMEQEIWMPPALKAHTARLVVGALVRVRLNGECEVVIKSHNVQCGCIVELRTHEPELNGATGLIIPTPKDEYGPINHPYCVHLDPLVKAHWHGCVHAPQGWKGFWQTSTFAAAELEIIDDLPAVGQQQGGRVR